jgi:hypothetical protein
VDAAVGRAGLGPFGLIKIRSKLAWTSALFAAVSLELGIVGILQTGRMHHRKEGVGVS